MSLKKTLILSVLLHLCFFTAVLFLSADTSGDSSKLLNEKVFIVKLAEDINKSNNDQPVVETRKKTVFDIQKELITKKDENLTSLNPPPPPFIKGGGKEGLLNNFSEDNRGLNTVENSSNIILIDYDNNKNEITNISNSSFASENKGISKGNKDNKGGLHQEIIEIIRNSIERVKTYPLLARKRGIEGTVYISFGISPQGKPQNLKILKGSGYSILDTATLDIVRKAAPFPYVDSTIEVPVVFRLD